MLSLEYLPWKYLQMSKKLRIGLHSCVMSLSSFIHSGKGGKNIFVSNLNEENLNTMYTKIT